VRSLWKRTGATHRLLREGNTIAQLTSEGVALDQFLHQDVAVWGQINDPSQKTPLITVTQVTPLSAQPSTATGSATP